jgi:broad specificity phosphatase PhoE
VTGRRLLLLRHGRTAWNSTGRAQGQADVALDDAGHEQAAAVAPRLAALRPAALWSSDLTRARETCAYLERATGLSAKLDERLREFDVGARQGMTGDQFQAAFPEAYAAWQAGEDVARVPGSEVPTEVAQRMAPALRESLGSLAAGETGIVVTHGACLKVGVLALLGWPLSQAADLRGVDNCRWVTLLEGPAGGLRLAGYNQGAGPSGGGLVDL